MPTRFAFLGPTRRELGSRRTSKCILLLVLLVLIFSIIFGRSNSSKDAGPQKEREFVLKDEDLGMDPRRQIKGPDPSLKQRPRFHLLVSESENRNLRLCKTMLSGAIMKYPAPDLISDGAELHLHNAAKSQADTDGICEYLSSDRVKDDDIVLIVEGDVWFQLPSTILMNRFIRVMHDSNSRMMEKYGILGNDGTKFSEYNSKVLFAAQKNCEHILTKNTACRPIPESILPADIYGEATDKTDGGRHNRPRYLNSGMVMGRAANLKPLYEKANEMLKKSGKSTTQDIFTEIFGRQEYARRIKLESRSYISRLLIDEGGFDQILTPVLPTHSDSEASYEFGIEVDHNSTIFQVLLNSEEDVQFMSYDSDSAKEKFQLPTDLVNAQRPFFRPLIKTPPSRKAHKVEKIDILPDVDWTAVDLAVNVVVPGGSVPAILDFNGNQGLIERWWHKMWFQNSSRALLKHIFGVPFGKISSTNIGKTGRTWWRLGGGKAGKAWSNTAETWKTWNQLCKPHHGAIFGDNRGEFDNEFEYQHEKKPLVDGGDVESATSSSKSPAPKKKEKSDRPSGGKITRPHYRPKNEVDDVTLAIERDRIKQKELEAQDDEEQTQNEEKRKALDEEEVESWDDD